MKKVSIIIICIVAAVCLYYLIDYIIYTDEEKIREILEESKRGIEEENPILATSYLSEDYKDIYGLSKEDLQKIGEGVFAKFEDFKVLFQKFEVDIESEKASVKLPFRIFVTYNGQRMFLFGDLNRAASVTLLFEKNKENDKGWAISGLKDLNSRWPISASKKHINP